MSKTFRVGIIGFGHVHVNHVAALYHAHPRARIVACADTRPLRPELRVAPYTREWNRDYVMSHCGLQSCYDDYREMLQREALDVVMVTTENAQHAKVVEACAKAGAHVCVEKPMATSLTDALLMARACREAGTAMIVNWPSAWLPHARKAKEAIDTGAIGRVLEVGYRVGDTGTLGPGARHKLADTAALMTGPERGATWWHQTAAGGGALLDLCCYGAMYSRWYVGESATAALGMKANLDSQWGEAEDNGRHPRPVPAGDWHGAGIVVHVRERVSQDQPRDRVWLIGHSHLPRLRRWPGRAHRTSRRGNRDSRIRAATARPNHCRGKSFSIIWRQASRFTPSSRRNSISR